MILVLVIYLLLIAVTDLPSLPVTKPIKYLISKVSAIFQSSSELSPEKPVLMIKEPKYNGEGNKLIFLSVITVLFLRYLLVRYKHEVFKYLPFEEILIEMYENDMENSPNSLIPTLNKNRKLKFL